MSYKKNLFYKSNDNIFQICEVDESTRPIAVQLESQYGKDYGLKIVFVPSGGDVVAERQRLSQQYSQKTFDECVTDQGVYLFSVRNEQPDDKVDIPEKIEFYEKTFCYDIYEFDKNGTPITQLLSVHSNTLEELLQFLEIKATLPFCDGPDKTIEYAINKDNLRKNLNSVIFNAQTECEKEKQATKRR